MKRNHAKLTSRKFLALLVTTGTGLFSLSPTAVAQEKKPTPSIPAVVLRPSSQHASDCEVELDRPEGSSGYRLRISIPDSVSTIEVAPTISSGRSFRIRMDDSSPNPDRTGGTPSLGKTELSRNGSTGLRSPMDVMANANWQRANGNQESNIANQSSANPLTKATGNKYMSNPFFATPTKIGDNPTLEQLATQPRQNVERSFAVEPITLDEVASIKVVSLDSSNETAGVSVAATSVMKPAPSLASISVAPTPTEMLGSTADFKPLETWATSPTAVQYTSDFATTPTLTFLESELSAVADTTTHTLPEIPANKLTGISLPVKVTISGPKSVAIGGVSDYTVTVSNESMIGIEDLSLTLTTTAGMDVLVIEKPAEFDEPSKTLTWELPRIEAGGETTLRYKIGTVATGQFKQDVVLWQGKSVSTAVKSIVRSTK